MMVCIAMAENETLLPVGRIPIHNTDTLLTCHFSNDSLRHVNSVVKTRTWYIHGYLIAGESRKLSIGRRGNNAVIWFRLGSPLDCLERKNGAHRLWRVRPRRGPPIGNCLFQHREEWKLDSGRLPFRTRDQVAVAMHLHT